jgi:hypothetical protein
MDLRRRDDAHAAGRERIRVDCAAQLRSDTWIIGYVDPWAARRENPRLRGFRDRDTKLPERTERTATMTALYSFPPEKVQRAIEVASTTLQGSGSAGSI